MTLKSEKMSWKRNTEITYDHYFVDQGHYPHLLACMLHS